MSDPVAAPSPVRLALAGDRFWDADVQRIFEERGEPLADCILQNREEVVALAEWMVERNIRSYLEIGIWTGRLVSALHRVLDLQLVAACDHGWAERCGFSIRLPAEVRFYRGDSGSEGYRRFREALGPVDLVLIDGNHGYRAVMEDFEINRRLPHRFLAFHDITGAHPATVGVRRVWESIDTGYKAEIVRPFRELGLPHSTMGIGLWSESEDPAAV